METKGFYKKAYYGRYQEYYTDRYYLAVGKVEKEQGKVTKWFSGRRFENLCSSEAELKREMVRKVNILVPIFDDSCFNYCGESETDRIRCKKEFCQALSKHFNEYQFLSYS